MYTSVLQTGFELGRDSSVSCTTLLMPLKLHTEQYVTSRLNTMDGEIRISFVIGKSRLAPIKLVTIPRLELCGAVLASRLHELVSKKLQFKIGRMYFWTDSMTVLRYLRNTKSRFKTFVANRIAVIQDLTNVDDWRHIPGELNPADLASRGFMPSEPEKLLVWHEGPAFLKTS